MAEHRAEAARQGLQDAEALARFGRISSGASIIEGGKDKPGLLAAAASAVASGVLAVGRYSAYALALGAVMVGAVSGVKTVESAYDRAAHAVSRNWEGTYGHIVATLQAEVGSGVLIYDRSAPKDWESARVATHLGMKSDSAAALPDFRQGGAYAALGISENACIVMGPTAHDTAHQRFQRHQERPARLGDVDDATTALDVISHEIGHCIIVGKGKLANEGQADAFAALMVMRSGRSSDHLSLLLASRSLDELVNKGDDVHYTSPSLRWVLEKSRDPAFVGKVRGASMEELVEIAKEAPSVASAPGRIARIRDAFADLGSGGDTSFDTHIRFVVPVEEGFVMTDRWEWLRANSDVPEFRFMVAMSDYLSADPATRVLPAALVENPEASAVAIGAMAERGDPMAAKLAPAFGAALPEKGSAPAEPIHRAHEVKGELVAFDRSTSTVSFDRHGRNFIIKDIASGKVLLSGVVGQGVTREHGPHQNMDFMYDPTPIASRR